MRSCSRSPRPSTSSTTRSVSSTPPAPRSTSATSAGTTDPTRSRSTSARSWPAATWSPGGSCRPTPIRSVARSRSPWVRSRAPIPTSSLTLLAESGDTGSSSGWLGVGRWLSYAGVAVLVGGFFVLAVCAPNLLADQASPTAADRSRRCRGDRHRGHDRRPGGDPRRRPARPRRLGLGRRVARRALVVRPSRPARPLAPLLVAGARRVLDRRPSSPSPPARMGWCCSLSSPPGATRSLAVPSPPGSWRRWCISPRCRSGWAESSPSSPSCRRELWAAASRFSPIALGAVVALALTGVINAWRQLDGIDSHHRQLVRQVADRQGPRRRRGGGRRRREPTAGAPAHRPPGRRPSMSTVGAATAPTADQRVLRRSVMVELAGMAVVLVATVGLVDSPPPRAIADSEPRAGDRHRDPGQLDGADRPGPRDHGWHHDARLPARYRRQPGRRRRDHRHRRLARPGRRADRDPDDPAAPNHVTTNDADFPIAGTWELTVTARFGEFDQVVLTTTAEIR